MTFERYSGPAYPEKTPLPTPSHPIAIKIRKLASRELRAHASTFRILSLPFHEALQIPHH
eukprot:3336968-Pleurochrysis_carterae.AAC.9